MKVLYQGSYFCSVKRVQEQNILAETAFLSTLFEATGKLVVDSKTYSIKEARWDVYRSPGGELNGGGFLPDLIGLEAYFSISGVLNRVISGKASGLIKELLAECVRGVIQAETYIFKERGYDSADDYEQWWRKEHVNSCRYYSNLDRVINSWFDYIGYNLRENNLFNRNKSFTVYNDNGRFYATGHFSDSFHEVGVQLSFNGLDGKIVSCRGDYLRAPDAVCFENISLLDSFIGRSINGINKKEVAKIAGGPSGCFHLVDIIYDTLVASNIALKNSI
ncbi:MAG: DUF2889 domain-containing protein [Pelotomaculum sp.]|nr:DUF2889 domain-containing protein [Pelotomaculum sp.]